MGRRQGASVDDLRAVGVVSGLVEIDQLAAIGQQRVRLVRVLKIGRCTHRAAPRASATTSCLPFAIGSLGATSKGRPEAGTGNLLKSTRTIARVVRTRLALVIS